MAKILILDDDVSVCELLSELVEQAGHTALWGTSKASAFPLVEQNDFDVVLLDIYLPDGNGLDLLPYFKSQKSKPEVIIMTGLGDPDGAELALRNGAWDYVQKPISPKAILQQFDQVIAYREQGGGEGVSQLHKLKRDNCIGRAPEFVKCLEQLALAAKSQASVLLTGETGTGKEVFARCLHANSLRATEPFVVVDCTNIPENIIESILFGHEKGAFTGAQQQQTGLIEAAHGGSLFLDEIGDLPLALQKKLLRVLQEKKYRKLGSSVEKRSDFRLIAATHRNLRDMIARNLFREDLLYRIQTVTIELPPLRKRREDLEELIDYLLKGFYKTYAVAPKQQSSDFIQTLKKYDWPGNIRQLSHALETALVAATDAPVLFAKHLPNDIRVDSIRTMFPQMESGQAHHSPPDLSEKELSSYKNYRTEALHDINITYLTRLMDMSEGDIAKACSISGLGRSRLYGMLKEYGLRMKKFKR